MTETLSPISPQCRNLRHRVCLIPEKCDCECHDSATIPGSTIVQPGDQFPCREVACDRVFDTEQGERVHWIRTHKNAPMIEVSTYGEHERAYLPAPATPRAYLVARVVAFLTDRTTSEVLAGAAEEWSELKMKTDKDVAALVEVLERRADADTPRT